jgi:uncharacterized protein (UPF0332 family)
MRPGTEKILAKAAAAVVAARRYGERGALDLAVGRSVYAMLHAARAVLNEDGVRTRVHSEVQAALRGRRLLPGDLSEWLDEALRRRSGAGDASELVASDVELWIDRAAVFVAAAGRVVGGSVQAGRGGPTCSS